MSRKPIVYVIVPIEDDLKTQISTACDVRYLDFSTSREEMLATIVLQKKNLSSRD